MAGLLICLEDSFNIRPRFPCLATQYSVYRSELTHKTVFLIVLEKKPIFVIIRILDSQAFKPYSATTGNDNPIYYPAACRLLFFSFSVNFLSLNPVNSNPKTDTKSFLVDRGPVFLLFKTPYADNRFSISEKTWRDWQIIPFHRYPQIFSGRWRTYLAHGSRYGNAGL